MTRLFALVVAAVGLAATATPVSADIIYDTTPSWNGSSVIYPFGHPHTSTYGQTFLAPSSPDTVLTDFTFYLQDTNANLSMKAYVFAWAGSLLGGGGGGATGPALYSSPSSIVFTGTGTGNFIPVTINTGGINLTPGGQYVAFLTISDPSDYAASSGTTSWGINLFSHVANSGGGGFVFYNNGNNFAALNTTPWGNFTDFGDLAWKATFTAAIPEPVTLAVFGLMAAGAFGVRRRMVGSGC